MTHIEHAQFRAGTFMIMQADIYFQTNTYFHTIDKLEAIVRAFDPEAPDMVRSDLIQVLGEELGIWPISVFERADAAMITAS